MKVSIHQHPQLTTSVMTHLVLGNRQAVSHRALNSVCVGSNPTSPGSCVSSSSLGHRFVVPVTRVRISSHTPCARWMMVIRAACKTVLYQFESKLSLALCSLRLSFAPFILHFRETLAGAEHRLWRHLLMVRKAAFQADNTGSIPVDAANYASLAQRTEHFTTNEGCREFESLKGLLPI